MSDDSTISYDARKIVTEATRRAAIVLVCGDRVDLVEVSRAEPVIVGRGDEVTIRFEDRGLSRRHARFELQGSDVWVEDLGSTNGTLVNGQPTRRARLGRQDRVELGPVVATLHLAARPSGTAAAITAHDKFIGELETALDSARQRQQPLFLALADCGAPGVEAWCQQQDWQLPASAKQLGAYSPRLAEMLVTVENRSEAEELLRSLLPTAEGRPALVGVAAFPEHGRAADDLFDAARAALQHASVASPVQWARPADARTDVQPSAGETAGLVFGPAMKNVIATVRKVARSNIPVLLSGETGVGKEVVARLVHDGSARRDRPMVCFNCGAITDSLIESTLFGHEKGAFTGAVRQSRGLFEDADGGTVFLDEIGELPAPAQAALLRVLETHTFTRVGSTRPIKVDMRLLAATNRDLEACVDSGTFRSDLLFRLNAVTIDIPPLRERPDDVEPLAYFFLQRASQTVENPAERFTAGALAALQRYSWPGNVRELRNEVDRAVVLASDEREIGIEHLSVRVLRAVDHRADQKPHTRRPRMRTAVLDAVTIPAAVASKQQTRPAPDPDVTQEVSSDGEAGSFRERVQAVEAALIGESLADSDWNKAAAARSLRIPLRTLKEKVRAWDLGPESHCRDTARGPLAELERLEGNSGGGNLGYRKRIERFEASLIDEALAHCDGNKSAAARRLRMPLETLKYKLRKHAAD